MKKIIFFIIGLGILIYLGYRYFELDKNAAFQKSLENKDVNAAEVVVRDAIATQLQKEAKQFFHEHNNYFISKSNNICTSIQSHFDGIKKILDNPVECVAEIHTFTARIKTGKGTYYCVDSSGFSTISNEEKGYDAGVRCK